MNKDLARYKSIIQKFMLNPSSVTKGDMDFFVGYSPMVDEAKMKAISEDENGRFTPEQVSGALDQLYAAAVSNPEYKQKLVNIFETKEKGKIASNVKNALNTALAGFDVASSLGQISESRRAARRSRRPDKPAPLTAEPRLDQALNEAQAGTMDAARRLAPAQLQQLDQYLSDLNVAKTASTGQAGTYGAMAQTASNRRRRGALELGTMADQIKAREQGRYDQLLGQKLNENRAMQQSGSQFYPQEMYQYNQEQRAIADLGSQGRSNLRGALPNLGQASPDIIANAAIKKRMMDIYNKMNVYGQGALAVKADGDALQYDPYQFNSEGQINFDNISGQTPFLEQMYPYGKPTRYS